MYKEFYNLKQDPFCLTPDPQFVYLTAQHREALSGLVYSVMSRPGLTLLIGEAGTGKTTLLYTLRMLLEKRRYCVVLCVNPTLEPNEFYDFLLAKIAGKTSPQKSRQLMVLEETLLKNHAEGQPSILMIDEAHRLPLGLLEEIRLLLNLETPREKLLEIILAGQQELTEVFRRPDLRQLKQRVSYVCKLKPLNFSELRQYIHHRMRCAGRTEPPPFAEEALRAIYQYTNGIPRLVNTLCDNSLQIGYALQSSRIALSIVEEAANDLDLVPTQHRESIPASNPSPSNPFLSRSQSTPSGNGASSSASGRNGGAAGAFQEPAPLAGYAVDGRGSGFWARVVGRRGITQSTKADKI
jgi:general secretion pathway protein A